MHFAIRLHDRTDADAAGLRDASRAAHLDYLAACAPQTLFAGPFLTDDGTTELGSHRLMAFADRAAAERHVADEPYAQAGLQVRPTVQRWSPAVPFTHADCPRTPGHVQVLIEALDRPDGAGLREALRPAHDAYQTRVAGLYVTRGPLLSDDGQVQIGSLMIIDVPDMAAARAFWDTEPFNAGGLFASIHLHRWRFGRIFDRLAKTAET